jgi:hypothetical protein
MRSVLATMTLVVAAATAHANSDGLVLRAGGFFDAESSGSGGTCTVPGINSGIAVSSDTVGIGNTFGVPTFQYPSTSCGGWLQLINSMTQQGINIEKVDIRLRIAGANRYRQFVPTRKGFPTACRQLRNSAVFSGMHLFPLGTDPSFGNTGSGAAHVGFVNLFPMVSAQVMTCLREQYSALPPDLYVSFPLIIRAVATGLTESGQTVRSNPAQFTLTLLHLCGNGRIDFGEECDPNAAIDACNAGFCDLQGGTCTLAASHRCASDADCQGTCLPQGDPMECNCAF